MAVKRWATLAVVGTMLVAVVTFLVASAAQHGNALAGCGEAATWRAVLVAQDSGVSDAIHTADAEHDYRTVIAQIDQARATLTVVPTRAADFWAAYEQGLAFIRGRMVSASQGTPQAQVETEPILALQDAPNATWAAGCRYR